MNGSIRQMVEAMKQEMVTASGFMRQANAQIPVQGERIELPLVNRTLDAVFYRASQVNAPLVLGFHGGGFLFGGSAMDDALWKAVSDALEVNVISVGYRMAPEFRFPAPVEDAYDTAIYLKSHAAEYGFDPEHISVMGSSAGANIAASLCLMMKERGGIQFDQQILVYPFLDAATDPLEKGYAPEDAGMYYVFNELYREPDEAKSPLCSPRFASDAQLIGLPRAVICTAGDDILRREGEEYADRLVKAGGEVAQAAPAEGMPHGYFEYGMDGGTGMGTSYLPEPMKALLANGRMQKAAKETLVFIQEHFVRS